MSAQYVVPEEWRGRVAEAIGDALGGSCMRQAGACSDDPEFCGCQRAAAAALGVMIPLVVAQERERCIAIAQAEHGDAAQDIDMATRGCDETGRLQSEGAAHAAARIAAAIRQEPGHE